MKSVKPWGNSETASILVIGHDPRLQNSRAEAECAFFFEYLTDERPTGGAARAKYDLAKAVLDYVSWLAGTAIPKEQLYVTNLCNMYLDHKAGSGTVLLPDTKANAGIAEIRQTIASGHFKLVLPFSVQVFYHLSRSNFLDENTRMIQEFVRSARPRDEKKKQGIYASAKPAPFLTVCGQLFHHRGVPVVPVLHIKQWRGEVRVVRYKEPMEKAKIQVCAALA